MAGNSFTATLRADSGPFKKGVSEAVKKLEGKNVRRKTVHFAADGKNYENYN